MRRLEMRGRLMLGSVVVLGLVLAVLSLSLNLLLANRLSADASSVLRDRAAATLATLETDGGRLNRVQGIPGETLEEATWVLDGPRVTQQGQASAPVQAAVRGLAGVERATERKVGESVVLLAVPARREGRRRGRTVVVGLSLSPYERTEHLAVLGTILLDLFALVAVALLTRRVVGAALRPVSEMTERAARWSAQDLHRRFALGAPRDELTALAATFDDLLGRLDGALRHEQRFSAEIAHELRTPLSGVRMEAELALRDGQLDEDRRRALEQVLAGTDRMAAVIDTLLTTARGQGSAPGACDPFEPVEAVANAVRPAADAHGIRIDLRAEPGTTTALADADMLAQAVHPLLENAVRHAAATVTVTVEAGGDEVVVAVEDDGPGISPADAEEVFAPGVSRTGGAGLGLPLARRLARTSGGDVLAAPAAGEGGARFELRVPGAAKRSSVRPGRVLAD